MSKREYIGTIFTDVASILVGDPCKVLPRDGRSHRHTYDELMGVRFADRGQRDPKRTIALDEDLIVVPTVESCDGWCRVYVERGADRWPRRLIVDLSAGRKPNGEGNR